MAWGWIALHWRALDIGYTDRSWIAIFFVKIDFIGDLLYCTDMDCVALEIAGMAWR
jgi:hypothetical protein